MFGRGINMKTCSKCKVEKTFDNFQKHSSNKDGYQYQCKQCRKETCSISFAKTYSKNKEEKQRKAREYYWTNREKHLLSLKQYRESVKGKATRLFHQRNREAVKLQRTPAWADGSLIRAYYDVCAFFNEVNGFIKYHVDHTVPLKGKNVCGLHVHNNLQVILAKDNQKKYNHFEA